MTFLGRHFAQFAHGKADFALFADGSQTHIFQRGFVVRIGNRLNIFIAQIVHHRPPKTFTSATIFGIIDKVHGADWGRWGTKNRGQLAELQKFLLSCAGVDLRYKQKTAPKGAAFRVSLQIAYASAALAWSTIALNAAGS